MSEYRHIGTRYGPLVVSAEEVKSQAKNEQMTSGASYGRLVVDEPPAAPAVVPEDEPLRLSAKDAIQLLHEQPGMLGQVMAAELAREEGPRKSVVEAAIIAAKREHGHEDTTAERKLHLDVMVETLEELLKE